MLTKVQEYFQMKVHSSEIRRSRCTRLGAILKAENPRHALVKCRARLTFGAMSPRRLNMGSYPDGSPQTTFSFAKSCLASSDGCERGARLGPLVHILE